MKIEQIHKLLDEDATLTITATGVSFVSTRYMNVNRQANIQMMQEGVNAEDREVKLIADPENPYDKFALEIIYEGYDCGWIPKDANIQVDTVDNKSRRVFVKGVNEALLSYNKKLAVEVDRIYGGNNGRYFGFTVEVQKA